MVTTPKHWASREQAQEWVAEARRIPVEINQADPEKRIEDWPLHKIAAYVYQDVGPEVLKVLFEDFRPEDLLDSAAELDRRRLPEVAACSEKWPKSPQPMANRWRISRHQITGLSLALTN